MTAPAEDPRGREDEVVIDDQCPITFRRCDRPCGTECIRGMFPAAGRGDTDSGGEAEAPECEHHSWAGLMALLDEHWPADIFPTREDDITRAAGARIVSLIRWVDRLRPARPAGDRAQPTQEVREAIARWEFARRAPTRYWGSGALDAEEADARSAADELLALPEVAALLDAQAAVNRVRELHAPLDRGTGPHCQGCATHVTFTPWPCKTIRALDGTTT